MNRTYLSGVVGRINFEPVYFNWCANDRFHELDDVLGPARGSLLCNAALALLPLGDDAIEEQFAVFV